ncbi:hypothetical protein NTG1052_640020 [Candidatus Nitrotoga sp. 1052]|nr:hypothetical protein NTG1052_640020 [Candidatus Nitrotoga sp. 1052]
MISSKINHFKTVAQVQAFLAGTLDVALDVSKAEHYGLIERVLKRFGYMLTHYPKHLPQNSYLFSIQYSVL